jgi:predicted Zn-dependent protease
MSRSAKPGRAVRVLLGAVAALAVAASPVSAQTIIRDTEIEGILREWSDPVFEAMGLVPDDVTLLLLSDDSVNAFATRGQIIGLHTGLILETRNPNQLLGVMAHEAGHVRNRHTIRDGAQMAGRQPMIVSMALGALAMAAGATGAGAALLGSSTYFGAIGSLTYLQSQEGEADITAARGLERAGVSGRGLIEFFERLRTEDVFAGAAAHPYLRSHPLTRDRIENLRRPVSGMSHYDQVDSPERMAQHAIVVAKMRAFLGAPAVTLREYPETDTSLPARYARAIAWYKAGEMALAVAQTDALIAEQPDNPYFWELKGQILFEGGRPIDAVPAHRRSVELAPDAPLLRINLGHALIETGDPENLDLAVAELRRATRRDGDNPLAWRLLSQVYATQGKEGEARLASAEYSYAVGRRDEAMQFALRARDMLPRGSAEWLRAMDIVLAAGATAEQLQDLDRRQQADRPAALN